MRAGDRFGGRADVELWGSRTRATPRAPSLGSIRGQHPHSYPRDEDTPVSTADNTTALYIWGTKRCPVLAPCSSLA